MHQGILTYCALQKPFRATVLFNIPGNRKALLTVVVILPHGTVLRHTRNADTVAMSYVKYRQEEAELESDPRPSAV